MLIACTHGGGRLGDIFRLSPLDRRITVAVGAGISFIFKAPPGGQFSMRRCYASVNLEVEAIVPRLWRR